MSLIAFSIFLLAAGWMLRGLSAGVWRNVKNPHRLSDHAHQWVEISGASHAFTFEQLEVARKRAYRLTEPAGRIKRALVQFAILIGLLALVLFTGCTSKVQQHQQGGRATQTLGPSNPAMPTSWPKVERRPSAKAQTGNSESTVSEATVTSAVPAQTLMQPENPEGESKQVLRRTITTTQPDGSVVTTVETAETVIGGSQKLSDILKEYASGEQMKRLTLAIIMGLVGWLMYRNGWPLVGGVLAIGALVVAYFGIGFALGFGGVGLGVYIAYFVVRANYPLPGT